MTERPSPINQPLGDRTSIHRYPDYYEVTAMHEATEDVKQGSRMVRKGERVQDDDELVSSHADSFRQVNEGEDVDPRDPDGTGDVDRPAVNVGPGEFQKVDVQHENDTDEDDEPSAGRASDEFTTDTSGRRVVAQPAKVEQATAEPGERRNTGRRP